MTEPKKKEFKDINKAYGEDTIKYLTDDYVTPDEVIPTGVLSLDLAVGNGGLATGTIMEVYGPESAGKTTIAMFIMREAQRLGHKVAFVDMEHAFDTGLAKNYGLDLSQVAFSQPECGEQALGIVEMLVEEGNHKVIVVDSVDALVPRSVLEGDFGDSNMGRQAKMMSQALRKLTPAVSKQGVLLIFINQIRMKIGIVYGNPETTSGGNALKFYAKYRLEVRRREVLKDGTLVIGAKTRVKVAKNKKAPPFRECIFTLIYGKGTDTDQELADVSLELGIVDRKGAWMFIDGEQIGQGSKSIVEKIKSDPEFKTMLTDLVANSTKAETKE